MKVIKESKEKRTIEDLKRAQEEMANGYFQMIDAIGNIWAIMDEMGYPKDAKWLLNDKQDIEEKYEDVAYSITDFITDYYEDHPEN